MRRTHLTKKAPRAIFVEYRNAKIEKNSKIKKALPLWMATSICCRKKTYLYTLQPSRIHSTSLILPIAHVKSVKHTGLVSQLGCVGHILYEGMCCSSTSNTYRGRHQFGCSDIAPFTITWQIMAPLDIFDSGDVSPRTTSRYVSSSQPKWIA